MRRATWAVRSSVRVAVALAVGALTSATSAQTGSNTGDATGAAKKPGPAAAARQPQPNPGPAAPGALRPAPDLNKPTLYVVGYAHLDTQWRWCYPQVIREFIPATLRNNFALFDKYPGYVFNFSGSRRYRMMEEYYPEDFAKLKQYVAQGRWFTCGSSVDENDANVPSAESQIRHVLYGNKYFRETFGTSSDEFMLPDCFGFPASLPSVLAHCGLKGFSTQKLTWNAVTPIPFKVGVWNGPDGQGVMAALDPGAYVGEVTEDLSLSNGWLQRINKNGKESGTFADYHYYGTGDRGGSPTEQSVAMVEKSLAGAGGKGKVKVVSSRADEIFKDIDESRRGKLPAYKGELELIEHSAGSLTSASIMKRWNRKNELLADAAERAAVIAWQLTGKEYPAQRLEDAWYLVLGSQMHDILPGTSHPRAYDYSQNDEVIAANQLAQVLTESVGAVAGTLDTSGEGQAMVLFNPLSYPRTEVVEAAVPLPAGTASVVVTGPGGKVVKSQVVGPAPEGMTRIAFSATMGEDSVAAFHVAAGGAGEAGDTHATPQSIENARYKVTFSATGDIAGIYDKRVKREVLSGPITLNQCYEKPQNWPAWNQDWADRQKPVKEVVGGQPEMKVIEDGPARVAMRIVRREGPSTFTQVVSLNHSDRVDGDRVDVDNSIEWNARERSLRVAFPLSVNNKTATWDGQVGVVERPNSRPQQFEYAGQQWMDLTDADGSYGVSIINDCKYASDKPSDNTLRLTLLHTPGIRNEYQDQGVQDIGTNHVRFSIVAHEGDWRKGHAARHAACVNQPVSVFRTTAHPGALPVMDGFSLSQVPSVVITAIKQAESGDGWIVRLRETSGTAVTGRLRCPLSKVTYRFVDGQERPLGDVMTGDDGSFEFTVPGYGLRTVWLDGHRGTPVLPPSREVALNFDTDVASTNGKRGDGAMVGDAAYPAEQLPATLTWNNAIFKLGSTADGQKNAMACRGQEVALPQGDFDTLYLLAAADEDAAGSVMVGDKATTINFQAWGGFVGLWDQRQWDGEIEETSFNWKNPLIGLKPGFIKKADIAWYCSHHHTPKGDAYYEYSYLFGHVVPLGAGAKSFKLPDDPRIKVFAAAVGKRGAYVEAAEPLFDALDAKHPTLLEVGANVDTAGGNHQIVHIAPRLYGQAGSIRYTTDGSAPTLQSRSWTGEPFYVYRTTKVRAAAVEEGGVMGVIVGTTIEADDRTAPTVTKVAASYLSKTVRIDADEPISAEAAVTIAPGVEITRTEAAANGRGLVVTLAEPLKIDTEYTITVKGLRDNAPEPNVAVDISQSLHVPGPVYTLDEIGAEQRNVAIKAANLPVRGSDAWTINIFVKPEKAIPPRTLIAGFGSAADKAVGQGRYLANFASGMQLWSRNADGTSRTKIEAGKWQMLTAASDGKMLRMYKNGVKVSEQPCKLADDEAVVMIAPIDPWEHQRKFEGELAHFTIWPGALGEEALKAIMEKGIPK